MLPKTNAFMQQNQNSNPSMRAESAVAVPANSIVYGTVRGMELAHPALADAHSLTFTGQISYFLSEYGKGMLFVLLSGLFIVAMPSILSKRGGLKYVVTGIVYRAIDILGALFAIALTLPAWLIIPIAIKLDSPGRVFYSQIRVGINRRKNGRRLYRKAGVSERRGRDRRREDCFGKPFMVYKFRTMVDDAERNSGPVWAAEDDPRVTRFGMFLRKTRLDEIPQFYNVLKGDMTLVGPRPERPVFVRELSTKVERYSERLQVKPGLTGLAQVENGYDSSISTVARKIKYDLEYIDNKSIWTDIRILLKTIVVVFTGKGAH